MPRRASTAASHPASVSPRSTTSVEATAAASRSPRAAAGGATSDAPRIELATATGTRGTELRLARGTQHRDQQQAEAASCARASEASIRGSHPLSIGDFRAEKKRQCFRSNPTTSWSNATFPRGVLSRDGRHSLAPIHLGAEPWIRARWA